MLPLSRLFCAAAATSGYSRGGPSWPQAQLAQAVGTELAERYGVPFEFASPDRPQSGYLPMHTMTADEEAHATGAYVRFLAHVE